jgi:hypothetical protein
MSATKIALALVLCVVLGFVPARANIVKLEILKVEPAGPTHERITGKAYGELDPADPKNAVITDIELAPRKRARQSRVRHHVHAGEADRHDARERRADIHRGESGRGNALPNPEGHATLVSGWQGDVVPTTTNFTIQVPVARNHDGSSITGPLVLRFLDVVGNTIPLTIPRSQPSPYPPASLDTTKATLISATGETRPARKLASSPFRAPNGHSQTVRRPPFPANPIQPASA